MQGNPVEVFVGGVTLSEAAPLPVKVAAEATAPVAKTPVKVVKVVAAASTAVKLVASETFATAVYLQAKLIAGDNAGNVFIGLGELDQGVKEEFEIAPGFTWQYVCRPGTKVDLNKIFIDADNSADGVVGWYEPV
ncbi:MAG: hypothetical protein JRE40_13550 [Deltaproteobacteria bacterium]|nr:hypothetical protein [Deltaproteobacteria bacterium]